MGFTDQCQKNDTANLEKLKLGIIKLLIDQFILCLLKDVRLCV